MSPLQVVGGVRTETVSCEDQRFSADLSGLNLNSGLEEESGPDSELYWDGKRGLLFKRLTKFYCLILVFKSSRQGKILVSLQIRAPGPLSVFGNDSRLGDWRAEVTVTRTRTVLELSLNSSHGLILGDLDNISFSFTLPFKEARSLVSAPVPGLLSSSMVRVCLRVIRGQASCQSVSVTRGMEARQDERRPSEEDIEVTPIPVLWHQDTGPKPEAK